jgi:hypothetical protein
MQTEIFLALGVRRYEKPRMRIHLAFPGLLWSFRGDERGVRS